MRSVIRFNLMWLAAWCQVLVVATMPLAPLAMAADPLGGMPICHAPDPAGSGQQTPSPEHGQHDCVLCAMCCQMHASPMALLSPVPFTPDRQATSAVRHRIAQPRAPPFRAVLAAQPRGPPFLT